GQRAGQPGRPPAPAVPRVRGRGQERPRGQLSRASPAAGCEHEAMTGFEVRLAEPADARAMAQLYAAVAAERDGIATEPPVDIREAAGRFAGTIDGTIVAVG